MTDTPGKVRANVLHKMMILSLCQWLSVDILICLQWFRYSQDRTDLCEVMETVCLF